jgi:hypothetical protein
MTQRHPVIRASSRVAKVIFVLAKIVLTKTVLTKTVEMSRKQASILVMDPLKADLPISVQMGPLDLRAWDRGWDQGWGRGDLQ